MILKVLNDGNIVVEITERLNQNNKLSESKYKNIRKRVKRKRKVH